MIWRGSGPVFRKKELNLISEHLKYKLFLPHHIIPSSHAFWSYLVNVIYWCFPEQYQTSLTFSLSFSPSLHPTPFFNSDKILTRGERLGGFDLLLKKVMAILIKRFHHTRRNWKGLIAQVILPIVFVTTAMGLGTLRNSSNSYPEIQISPSLYGTSEQTAFYA